ncbi:MAG: hypothetical protein GKS00_25885 [Alphaproteobacteria bacterium]|nr:hypothetical protein [Alphaproteobacteria bacterium]
MFATSASTSTFGTVQKRNRISQRAEACNEGREYIDPVVECWIEEVVEYRIEETESDAAQKESTRRFLNVVTDGSNKLTVAEYSGRLS